MLGYTNLFVMSVFNLVEPPVWNDWEDWSACSTSCGNGTKTRDRTCDQGQDCPDGTFCKGDEDMTDNCKENDLGKFIVLLYFMKHFDEVDYNY